MRKWSIALVLAGLLMLGVGGGIMAQTPAITQVVGAITAIDYTGKLVTITPPAPGTAVTLNVTASTEIAVPRKNEATLADLMAGDPVKARYETAIPPAIPNALEIAVEATKIQGEIIALDAATVLNAATVTIKPKVGDEVVLTVTDRTELEVWGIEPAVFDDLKVGQWVKAEYNATTATREAYVIEVKGKGEPSLAVRQGFFGTVTAKTPPTPTTPGSLTLDTKQGQVTFVLDANTTQYWDPPQRDATLADVKVGDRVAVLGERQDGTILATRVLVIPAKPLRLQITATVTIVDGNTITLTDKDSKIYTIELPAGLAGRVQEGDVLTITLLRTAGVEKYLASGMMKGDELLERLQSHVEKVKGSKPQTDEERGKQGRDLERVTALLQQNMEKHQDMMNKVMEKAPSQAREALQKAMENSRQGWEQALAALEKDRPTTPTPRGR